MLNDVNELSYFAMKTVYISNAFVSEALDCARRGGVNIAELLSKAQIENPGNGQVTPDAFGRLWLGIAEAMNDEFFGNAARPMRPGSFTLMGHAVYSAPTFEIALRRALRFLKVAIDEPFGALSVNAGVAQITLHDSRKDRTPFTYRTYWVILHGLMCWLAQDRIPLNRLDFTCDVPWHERDYHDFFGAPVTFNAVQGLMCFDARYLKRSVNRSEAELKRFLRTAPGNFLIGYQYDEGALSLVVSLLKSTEPVDWPTLPKLARQIDLSAATLRRQLLEQGHSYRSLKSDVRRQNAQALLRDTDLSVTEIAHRLGYAEPSAFFRAFRAWSGQTPQAWRNA